jgi:uncharacterized protein with PIN domain
MNDPIKFYIDEDVFDSIATLLRGRGFDAVSTNELGRNRESDESQLLWACEQNRVIVTFNVAHFAKLHSETLNRGHHHSGIVVSNQIPLGEVFKRLIRLTNSISATEIKDRLEFLSDWKVN